MKKIFLAVCATAFLIPFCSEAVLVARTKPRNFPAPTKQIIFGCTRDYKPVCGIDGKTYSNSCEASTKRILVRHSGVCVNGK